MKHIGQHRRAEDEAHLILSLPGLQFFDHVESDKIALLNVDAIRRNDFRHVFAQPGGGAATGQQGHHQRSGQSTNTRCKGRIKEGRTGISQE